ncbi:MAG: HAMP domain-containing sensor histidine kinase [Isosphaeraceae bacterium]
MADLRSFARLDEAELKEVDVDAGIRATAILYVGHAERAGVGLELRLGAAEPVLCYPGQVNQLVLNLVTNAIDACQPGGRVTLTTRRVGDGLEIEVADTGHGIDPSILDRIFDPFFTTRPIGSGAGLGLAISYGIVQRHRGRIAVESSPGAGSRFTVRLPDDGPHAPGSGTGWKKRTS